MILELSKKTFEELEIYKDLYPYEYDTNNKDLTNTLTRLIFKAFNHGKMSGSRTILNKINIEDTKDKGLRISLKLETDIN